jgi:hypothetical protein
MDNNFGLRPNREETNYTEGKLRPQSFWRRYLWQIIAVASLLLVIVFGYTTVSLLLTRPSGAVVATPTASPRQPTAISQSTAAVTPTTDTSATPTAASTQPSQTGVLPCNVNINTWTDGSADWKVLNGVLLNDASGGWNYSSGPTIVAPCQLGNTANYAVEAKIQVTSVAREPCFGMTVRGNPTSNGWQGYKGGVGGCGCCNTLNGARISGPDYFYDSQIKNASFDPGSSVHTYRVEVRDNTIQFFIDGGLILNMTDNRYLSGSEVGLWCQNVQLAVSSFTVTSL